jgi:hypothetical protein
MPEYQPVYSDRGRLRYIPDHLESPRRTNRGTFQGRNRRPHRIHIATVAPDPLLRRQRRQTTSKSYITEKLAVQHEGAKRFFRSLLDNRLSSKPETADLPTPRSSASATSSNRSSVASIPESRYRDMRSLTRNPPSDAVGSIGGSLAATAMPRPSAESHWSSGRSSAKSIISSVKPVAEEKPVASGGGLSVNVQLTEPVLFLRGFEQAEHAERSTAMLRGTLCLKITKPSKLKAVTLKFRGKATTKWPEGKSPRSLLLFCSILINYIRHSPQKDRI